MKKKLMILGLFSLPLATFAHVRYVLEKNVDYHNLLGNNWMILKSGINNTGFLIGIISSLLLAGVLIELSHTKFFKGHLNTIKKHLSSYHEFVPWIIRVCLGIALIGAGTNNFLISPIMNTGHTIAKLEVFLGFFFLAGFLLVPVVITTVLIYIFGLFYDPYFLGNLDFLALTIGLFVFHSSRPGMDDILDISLLKYIKIKRKYLSIILRIGVGVAMIYLGLFEKLLNPNLMEHVINQFHLTTIIPVTAATWVLATGIIETLLGLIIMLGLFTRTASIIGIIVISTTFFFFNEAVFSHVTLFGILSILAIEGSSVISIDNIIQKRKLLTQTK